MGYAHLEVVRLVAARSLDQGAQCDARRKARLLKSWQKSSGAGVCRPTERGFRFGRAGRSGRTALRARCTAPAPRYTHRAAQWRAESKQKATHQRKSMPTRERKKTTPQTSPQGRAGGFRHQEQCRSNRLRGGRKNRLGLRINTSRCSVQNRPTAETALRVITRQGVARRAVSGDFCALNRRRAAAIRQGCVALGLGQAGQRTAQHNSDHQAGSRVPHQWWPTSKANDEPQIYLDCGCPLATVNPRLTPMGSHRGAWAARRCLSFGDQGGTKGPPLHEPRGL